MHIICQKEKCGGVVAHVKGKLLEIIRSKNAEKEHRILIVASDVSVIATCPRCYEQTQIIIEGGKINTEELTIKQDDEKPIEQNPNPEAGQ